MFHIIYMSSAVGELSVDELRELLGESREWNKQEGITGALFYKEGNFLQVIEGNEAAVRELFARISRDPRHRSIMPMFQEEIPEREFPGWTMAFHDLNFGKGAAPEGFDDLLNRRWSEADGRLYSAKVRAFLRPFTASREPRAKAPDVGPGEVTSNRQPSH